MNPTNQALAQIFISYKREDEAFARRLWSYLKQYGSAPWLDVEEIKPGSDWDTEIHRGLRGAQIVVGLLTPESLASRNVLDEWGYALSTGKRLFLLWLRDVEEADIPPRYIRFQRIDLRHDETRGMEQLGQALQSAAKILAEPSDEAFPTPIAKATPTSLTSTAGEDFREEEVPATPSQKTNRSRMLEKVKVFWIEGVLNQSLHGVALLELGLQPRTSAVENPWDTVLQHTAYGDYRLPAGTSISAIYHDLSGELLILGDPGSGKTTTLLELARERIALAEKDDSEPIPVVLNLSSWADTRKPLFEWLVDELNTKYAVPRKVARGWLEADALLLLLDGLDEVLLRYRDACVAAINDYRKEHGFTHMVVCSRILDYEALTTRLHLNGAIVLQPLNDEQIDTYLGNLGSEMSGVRAAMTNDADLRKLAETPLMLSIMTLAFRGVGAADLPPLDSVEAQRRRLFEMYTTRMFVRRPPKKMSRERIMHYLTWLAGRMVERKQSVFYIENLQVDWIAGDFPQRLYRIVGRTAFGAVGGAAVGVVGGIAFLLLAFLLGDTNVSSTIGSNFIGGSYLVVTLSAWVGAVIFALYGLQAYALDTLPETIRPIRYMARRMASVIAAGAGLGLVFAVLTGIGALVFFLPLNVFNTLTDGSYLGGVLAIVATVIGFGLVFFVGSGAFSGAVAAAVAAALKLPRRRLLVNIAFLGGYGLVFALLVSIVLVGLGLFFSLWDSLASLFFFLAGTLGITCALLPLVGYMIPRRWRAAPYILISVGLTAGGWIGVILGEWVMQGTIVYDLLTFLVMSAILLGCAAAVGIAGGYFLTRITDHIESAESLRWRWSRRWSLIGLAATLILGAALSVGIVRTYSSYTEAGERDALARIADYETRQTRANSAVQRGWVQQEELSREISAFERLQSAVQEQIRIEAQLTYDDFELREQFSEIDAPALDCYSDDMSFSGYYYSFDYLSQQDYTTLTARQADLETILADFPAAAVSTLQNSQRNIFYCGLEAGYLGREIRFDRQRYTRAGLGEWAISAVKVTLIIGLAFILSGGVMGGLSKTETIDIRTRPNSGIRRTLQTALRVTVAFGLVGATIGGLVGVLISTVPDAFELDSDLATVLVPFCMVIGVSIGVGLGLLMGGIDAVVKHVVLRLFLQRSGSIPRNYATMLDEAADRILLRKVGGGYIFIHRYLLEYYAGLEGQSDTVFTDKQP